MRNVYVGVPSEAKTHGDFGRAHGLLKCRYLRLGPYLWRCGLLLNLPGKVLGSGGFPGSCVFRSVSSVRFPGGARAHYFNQPALDGPGNSVDEQFALSSRLFVSIVHICAYLSLFVFIVCHHDQKTTDVTGCHLNGTP